MSTSTEEVDHKVGETEGRARNLSGWQLRLVAVVAFSWSLFQLWYASPLPFILGFGVFIDVPARGIHLGFALLICFLFYPLQKKSRNKAFTIIKTFLGIPRTILWSNLLIKICNQILQSLAHLGC